MGRFDNFMQVVLRNECGNTTAGYVNDPHDAGGETICGITRKAWPTLSVWASLDPLETWQRKFYKPTMQEMAEIYMAYRKGYYEEVCADRIDDDNLALQVFDCAVNCGCGRAIKLLQGVVGATRDGIIGEDTLGKTNKGNHYVAYKAARVSYYRCIAKGSNARYLDGWIARVNNTHL